MIYWIDADREQFKRVEFSPDFNVVLADSTETSSEKDSRNGLGKSTLIDIVHFLLGSKPKKDSTLRQEPLEGWTFEMKVDLRSSPFIISRSTSALDQVMIEGNTEDWPIRPQIDARSGRSLLKREEWTQLLGWAMFNLPVGFQQNKDSEKYLPTFRSLISYLVRRERGAYLNPFEHFERQAEWDKQVNASFLLSLNWEHARRWQLLRDRESELKELRSAIKTGLAAELIGSLGSLESSKVRLEREILRDSASLREFRVHPLHQEIEREANRLTFEIRDLTNQNVTEQGMLSLFEQSLEEETAPDENDVIAVYNEIGLVFPGHIVKRIEEVSSFHQDIVRNRRSYLEGEIGRLREEIARRQARVANLSATRSEYMRTLASYGALDEFNRLQQALGAKVAELENLNHRIALWHTVEREESAIKIERERLRLDARADLEDRRAEWEEAIALFNANSEELYEASGEFIVDLKESGFRFDVEIVRSGSDGIEQMKIFCFDLMIAEMWSKNNVKPGFLIHDSNLYSDVDVRQRAKALQLAATKSIEFGFQYICTLNSDSIPFENFDRDFRISDYVRLTLTDENESSGLLGMRF